MAHDPQPAKQQLPLLSTNRRWVVNFDPGQSDAAALSVTRACASHQMVRTDERLTTLEMRTAEQERTIEELSGQIAEQWNVVDRLQKKLDSLVERFLSLEDETRPDTPVNKPPHW
jgi:SlyX protein